MNFRLPKLYCLCTDNATGDLLWCKEIIILKRLKNVEINDCINPNRIDA